MSKRETVEHHQERKLTAEQEEELRQLEAAGEDGIDTASIPPAPAEAWRHARRGPVTREDLAAMRRFFRPVKQPVSLRLDADILHWFKERSGGRGWQTEINRALRAHIERQE
jgi:uncharacterized protein (DUF4415 family)